MAKNAKILGLGAHNAKGVYADFVSILTKS